MSVECDRCGEYALECTCSDISFQLQEKIVPFFQKAWEDRMKFECEADKDSIMCGECNWSWKKKTYNIDIELDEDFYLLVKETCEEEKIPMNIFINSCIEIYLKDYAKNNN